MSEKDESRPKIFSIRKRDKEWKISRRQFFTAGLAAGASTFANKPSLGADSKYQATGSKDLTKNCLLPRVHIHGINAVAYSPKGDVLASGMERLKFWSSEGGYQLKIKKDNNEGVHSLAFTPNGKWLVAGHSEGKVGIWKVKKRKICRTIQLKRSALTYEDKEIVHLAVTPDGKTAVAVPNIWSGTKYVYIITVPKGEVTKTITSSIHRVLSIAINHNGTQLAIGTTYTLSIYSLRKGKEGSLIKSVDTGKMYNSLAFSSAGEYIIASASKVLELISVSNLKVKKKVEPFDWYFNLTLSETGKVLVTSEHTMDHEIKIWDFPKLKLKKTLKHGDTIEWHYPERIALGPGGKQLLVGYDISSNGLLRLLDVKTGKLIRCFVDLEASRMDVTGVRYSYKDSKGKTVTVVVPACKCTTVPSDAVCECNTVKGSYCGCVGYDCGCVGYCRCNAAHYWWPN
jgi:WD40 repeat protein